MFASAFWALLRVYWRLVTLPFTAALSLLRLAYATAKGALLGWVPFPALPRGDAPHAQGGKGGGGAGGLEDGVLGARTGAQLTMARATMERRRRRKAREKAADRAWSAEPRAETRRSDRHGIEGDVVNPLVDNKRRRTAARTRAQRPASPPESAADAADAAAQAGALYAASLSAERKRTHTLAENQAPTPVSRLSNASVVSSPIAATPTLGSHKADAEAKELAATLERWAVALRRAAHASALVLIAVLAWFYRPTTGEAGDAAWATRVERKLLLVVLLPAAQLYANAVRSKGGHAEAVPKNVVVAVSATWFIVGFVVALKLSEAR